MNNAQLYMHSVNIGFFVCAALLWLWVLRRIFYFNFPRTFKWTGALTALTAVILSILFIFLQWDWIVSGHNEAVGDLTSYLWLIWDYALSLFMLTLGAWVLVNINLIAECCDSYLVNK
jgi:hypothetical protein